MSHRRAAPLLFFLGIASSCLGCDQLTKGIARAHLAPGAPHAMAGGALQLALAENPGAFLSVGAGLPEGVRAAVLQLAVPLLLLLVCAAFLRERPRTPARLAAIALLVGGGVGNWLDRILHDGLVTDFVRISVGPFRTGIFNLADVAILLGVGILLALSWRRRVPGPA